MNKQHNIPAPASRRPAALTPEEKSEHILRAILQRRESYATAILYNLIQGAGAELDPETADEAVDLSLRMADRLLQGIYDSNNDFIEGLVAKQTGEAPAQ